MFRHKQVSTLLGLSCLLGYGYLDDDVSASTSIQDIRLLELKTSVFNRIFIFPIASQDSSSPSLHRFQSSSIAVCSFAADSTRLIRCSPIQSSTDMSCSLISPELGTTSFLCKQRLICPKLGILRCNSQQDLDFFDSFQLSGKKSKHQRVFGVPSCYQSRTQSFVIKCNNNPQNVDLPRYYSKKEKKPFPVPILELRRAARERMKSGKGQPKRAAPPPKNGLLVQRMIPLAYAVLNARTTLINNLKRLLKVVPVQACK
ncbi:hypothetical protein R6Q59_019660 [Mikania micrantha]